jgi:hypothetical protein
LMRSLQLVRPAILFFSLNIFRRRIGA